MEKRQGALNRDRRLNLQAWEFHRSLRFRHPNQNRREDSTLRRRCFPLVHPSYAATKNETQQSIQ